MKIKILQVLLITLASSTLVANIGFLIGFEAIKFTKELLILVVLAASITGILKFNFKKNRYAVAFLLLAGLSIFIHDYESFKQFTIGFRYEAAVLGLFCLAQAIRLRGADLNKIVHSYILGFSIVSCIALFIHIVLGPDFLVNLGYRPDWSTYYTGEATAFCQRIEHSEICRFQGFLSGPNVMAINSVFVMALALGSKASAGLSGSLKKLIVAICVIFVGLSFSRSGLLALCAYAGIYGYDQYKSQLRAYWRAHKAIFVSSIVVILGGICGFVMLGRANSNFEHFESLKLGLANWIQAPILGHGLVFSGPASRFAEQGFIPESWILQVANNLGLLGLCLFALWYLNVYKRMPKHLKFFLIALLIPLNLLHSFEDAGFSYAFAIIIGLYSQKEQLEA